MILYFLEKILAGDIISLKLLVYFLFYRFISQQVRVGGGNENKTHSDHFPIEFKSNVIVFPSILIQLEKRYK